MYRKLKNGQYFDAERGTFINYNPFLEGKSIMTKAAGLVNYCEFSEFENKPNESVFAMPAYCVGIEKRKNTIYANFFEFELVSNGKKPIGGVWVDFVENFEPKTVYLLLVQKNILYPSQIKVIKKFVIKK